MYFKARFADLNIGIEAQFPKVENFCQGYVISGDEDVDFSVAAALDEIAGEQSNDIGISFSMDHLETLAVQRKISEKLPFYQRFLMHGAVISYQGKAYMFTALSGTGKSTHIRLWREYLGEEVQVINGDKPFLWVKEDEVLIYGTPWAGKERWQMNDSAPLQGICFLCRGKQNRIRKVEPAEALSRLMQQIYIPKDALAAGLTLELLDQMLKQVPLYLLECDMSEEAVMTSFQAMTGLEYKESRCVMEEE